MPQMAPIYWLLLFTIMSISFLYITNTLFFFTKKKSTTLFTVKMMKISSWMW